MADAISYSLRSTFAKEFYQSLTDPKSDDSYYMFYGRAKPWSTVTTPTTLDTIKEQNEAKRNILFYQKIVPSDVSLVAWRYDWTQGTLYDQYEDDVQLWSLNKKFYVLVQDGDEYSVYMCLSNNGNSLSTVAPSGFSTEPITTSDGYVWKYMYTLTDEMEEFLTSEYMPVLILDKISYNDVRARALAVKIDSDNGSIKKITLNNNNIEFQNIVNAEFLDTEITVTNYDSVSMIMTANVGRTMSSTSGFYNTNYVVYFENGKIATIDSYSVTAGVASITLCDIYPNDGTPIQSGDVFSIVPRIVVTGNGTGAVAAPIFTNNILSDVFVINGGQNYNFAEAFFLVNTPSSISIVIPPDGGYGYDFTKEIKPTNILISKKVSFGSIPDDQEKYFGNSSFLRQIGIVKNIQTTLGTEPNNPSNFYDLILKYQGDITGTLYGTAIRPYTLPNFGVASVNNFPLTGTNQSGASINTDDFFIIGRKYRGTDIGNPSKPWLGTLKQKIYDVPNRIILFFEQESESLSLSSIELRTNNANFFAAEIFDNVTNQSIKFTNTEPKSYHKIITDNRTLSDVDVYAHFSAFNNFTGKEAPFGNPLFATQTEDADGDGELDPVGPNFFSVGDVVRFFDSVDPSTRSAGVRATISEIYASTAQPPTVADSSIFGRYNGTGIGFVQVPNGFATTLKLSSIQPIGGFGGSFADFYKFNKTMPDTTIQVNSEILYVVNETKGIDMILTSGTNGIANNFITKDKVQILTSSPDFTVSDYTFAQGNTPPTTAPTHILGNDTLSTAKIESFVVDPLDPSKLNLKITSPSDDFEEATITGNAVSAGESVTLFRRTPSGFTNTFTKVQGNTNNLYVLSENYDISSPNNVPVTTIGSVVSKIILQKTGSFGQEITPNQSYLYREPTETKDAAIGYIISQDSETGTTVKTKNVYVQMEKGSFENGDVLKCVIDPFVKNITLFSLICAGNVGVSPVTVSGSEQRYNNLFLNKYSGEVLYIQNIEPIQLSTDTNFTTRILLGF